MKKRIGYFNAARLADKTYTSWAIQGRCALGVPVAVNDIIGIRNDGKVIFHDKSTKTTYIFDHDGTLLATLSNERGLLAGSLRSHSVVDRYLPFADSGLEYLVVQEGIAELFKRKVDSDKGAYTLDTLPLALPQENIELDAWANGDGEGDGICELSLDEARNGIGSVKMSAPDTFGADAALITKFFTPWTKDFASVETLAFCVKQTSGLEAPRPELFLKTQGEATFDVSGVKTIDRILLGTYSPDWPDKLQDNYNVWTKFTETLGIPNTSVGGSGWGMTFCSLVDGVLTGWGYLTNQTWASVRDKVLNGYTGAISGDNATVDWPGDPQPHLERLQIKHGWTDGRSGEANIAYVDDLEIGGDIYDLEPEVGLAAISTNGEWIAAGVKKRTTPWGLIFIYKATP